MGHKPIETPENDQLMLRDGQSGCDRHYVELYEPVWGVSIDDVRRTTGYDAQPSGTRQAYEFRDAGRLLISEGENTYPRLGTVRNDL
jgi:hypothetical protein